MLTSLSAILRPPSSGRTFDGGRATLNVIILKSYPFARLLFIYCEDLMQPRGIWYNPTLMSYRFILPILLRNEKTSRKINKQRTMCAYTCIRPSNTLYSYFMSSTSFIFYCTISFSSFYLFFCFGFCCICEPANTQIQRSHIILLEKKKVERWKGKQTEVMLYGHLFSLKYK